MSNKLYHRMEDYYSGKTPEDLIKSTITQIGQILDKYYPEHLEFDDGVFSVQHGSCQVMIIVRAYTVDEACIECLAHVVTGANITDELMRFLLRKNSELHFGAFGLLFDDTITFSQSISTPVLDDKVVLTTLDSVAIISDFYDDIIVELAGGKRASDLTDTLF